MFPKTTVWSKATLWCQRATLRFFFTSAGMNQFKDRFLGKVKDSRRATSCQQCLRTGDLDEVGRTPFHHTFFEMLGNFSFGDYFKKEAIVWAWEFVTEVLGINKKDLWVSVYDDDKEALKIWKETIGLPISKIKKFGQKENFWPSNAISLGPDGPCGPCSEIYYQKKNSPAVEVWNLVFTQFNRCEDGKLKALPNKNIDTGMGLERMSSVLAGVDSNFKIDIFAPIISAVKKAVDASEERVIAVLADHARAVTFCIADGVLPSNDGRGYVVRKLIRRCLYIAQQKEAAAFLYKIVSSVAQAMSDQYPELLERRDNIAQIIKAEEEKYIKNILEGGSEKLNEIISKCKESQQLEVPAQTVADLYMTHGIPIEATTEALKKMNLTTNTNLALEIIKSEQGKTRESSKMFGSIFGKDSVVLKKTKFLGYKLDFCEAKVVQIIKEDHEVKKVSGVERVGVVLNETPFYAESGGQVGDKGKIRSKNIELDVLDVRKEKDSILHLVKVGRGALKVGDKVEAMVDEAHRQAVRRAHTATHILQAVLRQILGPHVQQAGSYVESDRFRFDFTHFKDITSDEMQRIRILLNENVLKNDQLQVEIMSKEKALKSGAIALFGEKYEEEVRVVSIAGYSKELCGGTHVQATGQVGLIYITSESSIGSGLRRIEALTGKEAYRKMEESLEILDNLSDLSKVPYQQLKSYMEGQTVQAKALERELLKYQEGELKEQIEKIAKEDAKLIKKDIVLVAHKFENYDISLLRRAIDLLKEKIPSNAIFFLSSVKGANAYFASGTTADLLKIDAVTPDKLMKEILPRVGGSGGGRKDFAQGGTKEIQKVDFVLEEVKRLIEEKI